MKCISQTSRLAGHATYRLVRQCFKKSREAYAQLPSIQTICNTMNCQDPHENVVLDQPGSVGSLGSNMSQQQELFPEIVNVPVTENIEESLFKWANEKENEYTHRNRLKDQIKIIDGKLVVESTFSLSNSKISSLPQNLHFKGILDLWNSENLTQLPKGLTVDSDLFMGCSYNVRELPQDLVVRGSLYLTGCTSLIALPESLQIGGSLDITGCTSLTALPDWVFALQSNRSVNVVDTGIPARLLAEYNDRQNAQGYEGPRFVFSIRDYHPTSDVSATQLPNLVQTITQTKANHHFWQFSANQTEQGSLFNSFALFLTRLLNELPEGNKRQTDLTQLRQKLTPLFRKMEAEYDLKNQDISKCDFINNHILSAAETATGTCIDKVKVGHLFMQLFVKDNFQQDLTTMHTIIKTVEDIASARVVFDASSNQFIHVAKTILTGDFNDDLKLQAKCLLKQTDGIELTEEETTRLEGSAAYSLNKNDLTQLLYTAIFEQNKNIRSMRIGDQVEDILNLAYKLLSDNFHKIDMCFANCCTLKNKSGEPEYETAAKTYIQYVLHYQELQHNAATAIQKRIRVFLVRKNQ